jgi:CubicO group peptidase (beta-lactamase class C family)
MKLLFCSVLLLVPVLPLSAALPEGTPGEAGMDPERLARIDEAVQKALDARQASGAVVLVARDGKVVFRKAYGLRAVKPSEENMTNDTLFDLASLTKPLATASSVLLLIERGKLGLTDPVAKHLPGFGRNGKDKVTVEHLLLHTSGLTADNSLADYEGGREKALARIDDLRLSTAPGERFVYSDVGFIVLGELVEKVSGQGLDVFFKKNVADPLGLRDLGYRPGRELEGRIAPTERADGRWLRGEVHDPRARRLGGVAGHAGLFGSADDVAVLGQALLEGKVGERKLLEPATVKLMTTPRRVPGGLRALGWDVRTAYSSNRGELFEGFGHTGFTGTSLWIDPPSRTLVVVLTSRLHPDGKGNVIALRRRVATLTAESIVTAPFPGGRKRTD